MSGETMKGFSFAQLTDAHLGRGLNPKEAARNLRWALEELASLSPPPKLALVTGDLVCAGKASELREFRAVAEGCPIPLYALPANHDLWGEPDTHAWCELIGPLRQSVVCDGVHVLLWNDVQRGEDGRWKAQLREEQREWLAHEMRRASGAPIIVAQHSPPLITGGEYHDSWRGSNAGELLAMCAHHNVRAVITGHWHRNGEWTSGGVRVITTGALCGWQWNETPPHRCFPTRPGYRLFHLDEEVLRTFWRDGSYWDAPAPEVQVTLCRIGDAHTGGPRPQVRPIDLFARTYLVVNAYALKGKVTRVEWSLVRGQWHPMERIFDGIWSEWRAEIDPLEFRAMGEHVCAVRAEDADGNAAYDAVPLRIAERECAAMTSSPAQAGREMLFDVFYLPR